MAKYSYSRRLISVAALAMAIGAATPALAQRQRRADDTPRATGAARQRTAESAPRRVAVPRVVGSAPSRASRVYRSSSRVVVVGRAAPRIIDQRDQRDQRGPRVGVGSRVGVGPRVGVKLAPVRFSRPYYIFRPRVHIGAGFFIGFPVAYSYGYGPYYYSSYGGYPYPAYPAYGYPAPVYGYPAPVTGYPTYPYPPQAYPQSPYSSPAPGSVVVQPRQVNTGAASFEITPNTAEVFVDGLSMGPVSQFTPVTAPLDLTPGRHHFEIRAAGYQTITFDADIVAGQVTPFQGTMER